MQVFFFFSLFRPFSHMLAKSPLEFFWKSD